MLRAILCADSTTRAEDEVPSDLYIGKLVLSSRYCLIHELRESDICRIVDPVAAFDYPRRLVGRALL